MAQDITSVAQAEPSSAEGFWPKGWWSLVDYKIGIIPLPVFVILIGVIGKASKQAGVGLKIFVRSHKLAYATSQLIESALRHGNVLGMNSCLFIVPVGRGRGHSVPKI